MQIQPVAIMLIAGEPLSHRMMHQGVSLPRLGIKPRESGWVA